MGLKNNTVPRFKNTLNSAMQKQSTTKQKFEKEHNFGIHHISQFSIQTSPKSKWILVERLPPDRT
jgi:hypothetical protein